MQQTYRCHLTVIASWQAYSARAASWHLYFCCIQRKDVQQSSPLYLIWYFQPPPWGCTFWGTISQSFSNLALPVQITFLGQRTLVLDASRWWWVSLPDSLPLSSILVITQASLAEKIYCFTSTRCLSKTVYCCRPEMKCPSNLNFLTFVTWFGPNVSVMKKAKMSTDKGLLKEV